MNRFLGVLKYSISLAIFSFYSVSAQEIPLLEHYLDENDNLFWPRSKPLYLFIDDDADASSSNRMKSQSTPEFADPLYLPNEGLNLLKTRYAVKDGKIVQPQIEVAFEIYADGIPPYTRVTFNAPLFKTTSRVYYGRGLTIQSVARDSTSGVKATYFSYSGADFVKSEGSFNPQNDGINDFRIYSLDRVNNAEPVQSFSFEIDVTAPETRHTLSGEFRGRVLSPKVEIRLASIDRASGVKATYYRMDEGAVSLFKEPIPLTNLADGDHVLTYYSIDQVKNEEVPIQYEFYLDKNPPVVEVKIVGDQYQNRGRMFISDRTNIEFSAQDNRAGVNKIYYRIDDGDENVYTEPFLLEKGTGSHVVKYYSVDQVGNGLIGEFSESNGGRKGLDIDMNAPTISGSFEGKTFKIRDTTFIRGDTKILLAANDVESGIKKLGYKVNGGTGFDYKEPIVFSEEGFYIIDYYATDYVNNRNSKDITMMVDNTGPIVSYSFSSRITQTQILGSDTLSVYQTGVKIYLQATDLATDTEDILYSVNGAAPLSYSRPVALNQEGINTITVTAIDRLGNKSSQKEIKVFIRN